MKNKIKPDAYLLLFLALSFILHGLFPIVRFIRSPYSFVGYFIMLSGLFIAFKSNFTLSQNKTSLKAFESPTTLIESGPFSYSRNPVYLGMFFILIGLAIILSSVFPFICTLLFLLLINYFVIVPEEIQLEKTFGKEYIRYKEKVRRWF